MNVSTDSSTDKLIDQLTLEEAIETLKLNTPYAYTELRKAVDMAIEALKEVEQYRALGTVEEIKSHISQSDEEFDMLLKYMELGTFDEIREAREKQIPKKILAPLIFESIGTCPECSASQFIKSAYCYDCGQKLDWSE